MAISLVSPLPSTLPFHADYFGWNNFERFCLSWLTADTTLPNFLLSDNPSEPSRLKIVDAHRVGGPGEKQLGIDIIVDMENGRKWVIQCKHEQKFGKPKARTAIEKAKDEYGKKYNPEFHLLWVTGNVTSQATFLASETPEFALWSAERMTEDFVKFTKPNLCRHVIRSCFSMEWAKAFFPLSDETLVSEHDYFSRWDSNKTCFHHDNPLIGREQELTTVVDFANGQTDSKALIVTAAGGIGKSRLLREAARESTKNTERLVWFTNPNASNSGDLPVFDDLSRSTIIHDDAHRMNFPLSIFAAMSGGDTDLIRLIFSARPGSEDFIQQQLMEAGFNADDIERISLPRLSYKDMIQLVTSILGSEHERIAAELARISEGCILIAFVGAVLLKKGELNDLDLGNSDVFREEVFTRLEKQELSRLSDRFEIGLLKRFVRSLALLSPWDIKESESDSQLSEFLGIQSGEIRSMSEALQEVGILVRTYEGIRISPDLFSDHLVYTACFEDGKPTQFIRDFLERFSDENFSVLLQNLAEAEWRAGKKHNDANHGILAPFWRSFLTEFENASFWERRRMVEKWAPVAVYQPQLTIELVEWAINLNTAPGGEVTSSSQDSYGKLLCHLPAILERVAICSEEYRNNALDLLLELNRNPYFSRTYKEPFYEFGEVASFKTNFPKASLGILDWFETLLDSKNAVAVVDTPSQFAEILLSPIFDFTVEESFVSDRRTITFRENPISLENTGKIREKAYSIVVDKIISRGDVAAINVIPLLGHVVRQTPKYITPSKALEQSWAPERQKALSIIASIGETYAEPLIQYRIRKELNWHAVFRAETDIGKECRRMIEELQNSLKYRLARLTLSDCYDDYLAPYKESDSDRRDQEREVWANNLSETVNEFLESADGADSLHKFLVDWAVHCQQFGFSPRFSELFREIARQDPGLGMKMIQQITDTPKSLLNLDAAFFLPPENSLEIEEVESVVISGLNSECIDVCFSFIHAVHYSNWLHTPRIIEAVLSLSASSREEVVNRLIREVRVPDSGLSSNKLTLKLLENNLNENQIVGLANAHVDQADDGKLSRETTEQLLQRIVPIAHLPSSFDDFGTFHQIARQFPLLIFEFFRDRVIEEEKSTTEGYTAIPYGGPPKLIGLENEGIVLEDLARGLCDEFFSRNLDQRDSWKSLFVMTTHCHHLIVKTVLLNQIPKISGLTDLLGLCSLFDFTNSLITYKEMNLVEAILKVAQSLGPTSFEEVRVMLIRSATPQCRGYSNGVLDGEFDYALTLAQEALTLCEGNRLLTSFYQTIIVREKSDAKLHREMYSNSTIAGYW
ncbi:MAG: hypothetical protein P1V20_13185 [Verrucomicrobiales bacterium]|nr:hypothetical protein [Verrucomicrobiales bacterium]